MDDAADTGSAGTATSNSAASAQFSERELQLLGWAMQSSKTGPPEIDYVKLAKLAGMSNHRSAGNAWAKLKAKLMTGSDGTVATTPKKASAKKKTEDGEEGTPTKKTPRKRVANKQEIDGAGEVFPKKRGRPAKKTSDDEAANTKADSDDAEPAIASKEDAMNKEV